MGDMSSGSSSVPSTQDEISLFLRQILLRSSSSSSHMVNNNARNDMSSMSLPAGLFCSNENALLSPQPLPFQDGILALDSTTSASPNKGASENENDEYDFESEEGEALAEEVPAKSVPSRSSSKRTRAAEVHNLSEKRRRSRINEKLKALQNLIPNSNKTDKASMLDEAIEYLKQLQLQVQMLSIRNGLNLHPLLFPEGLEPLQLSWMRMELGEKNRSIPSNMTATLSMQQENPLHYSSNLPNKCTAMNQPSVPAQSYIINPETSFGPESSFPGRIRPFQPRRYSEIGREDVLQHQQLNTNHSNTNPLGDSQGTLL